MGGRFQTSSAGRQDVGIITNATPIPGSEPKSSGVLQTPLNRREKRSQEKRMKKFLNGGR